MEEPGVTTILVVDDDPSILDTVTAALEDEGYRVLTAVNGAAVPLSAAEQPDVLLLDYNMPGMSGAEVSQRLRNDPATAHIPIVGMTALAQRAREHGMQADAWLPKPFALADLYETVAAWIERRP
jgi:CheY-like chemotaxis protein